MSRASTQASSPQPGLTREQRARALGQCPTREHCVLRAENVVKSFHRGVWPRRGTVQVLKGASLMVCQGELVAPRARRWGACDRPGELVFHGARCGAQPGFAWAPAPSDSVEIASDMPATLSRSRTQRIDI